MSILKPKKYLSTFLATLLLGVFAVVGINYFMDPFQYLGKAQTPYFSSKTRIQNAALIRSYDYDSVVMGTSRSMNFYIDDIEKILGWKSLKITMAGSTPHEQFISLKLALETGKVKKVLWGVDATYLYGTSPEVLSEEFPELLYSSHMMRFPYYLFNMTTLIVSARNLAFMLGLKKLHDFNVDLTKYNNILLDKNLDETASLKAWYEKKTHPRPPKATLAKNYLKENIEKNVLSLMREYPDVTFYMVLLPHNIMCHLPPEKIFIREYNRTYLEFFKAFSKLVLPLKNVKAFNFLTQKDLICDFEKYHDESHFYAFVNRKMLEDISTGKGRFIQGDVPVILREFLETISEFYDQADHKMSRHQEGGDK